MRRPDWELHLSRTIAAYQGGVFTWGERDCFTLVREAVFRQSGVCIWPEIRYGSWREALARLRRHGFGAVGDALAEVLEEIAPAQATRGDVGVVMENGMEAGVVVLGADLAGMAPDHGLTIVPRGRLARAFRVA